MNLRNMLYATVLSTLVGFNGCKKESPVEPAVNHPPRIERIVANPEEPFTEGTVNLECIARDEDNDPLYYDWRSDGGYFDEVDKRQVIWNSPKGIGTYHITVKVDDRREIGTASRTVPLNVVSRFDTLYATDDAYTVKDWDFNNGNGGQLDLYKRDNDDLTEIYLRFGSIQNKEIRWAKFMLTLFPIDTSMGIGNLLREYFYQSSANVYRIRGFWDEENIKESNTPYQDLNPITSFVIEKHSALFPVHVFIGDNEITQLVQLWGDNPNENNGIKISSTISPSIKSFYSKEHIYAKWDLKNAPALIVEYE